MNNGVIERMKAATHMLVSIEIESAQGLRDPEAYRRKRLPEVLADHREEWQQAYIDDPRITVTQLVSRVTGQRVEAQRIARGAMERNMDNVRRMLAEEPDVERNLAGIAEARQALTRRSPTPSEPGP
jgi:hypothetical protein